MRNRSFKTVGLAGAVAMLAVGTAVAAAPSPATGPLPKVGKAQDKFQTIKGKITPAKKGKKKRAGVLDVTTGTGLGNTPNPNYTGVPGPAVRAVVFFDKSASIDLSKHQTCDVTTIGGLNTAAARAACPKAIIGQGTAAIRLPGVSEGPDSPVVAPTENATVDGKRIEGETPVTVTAFRNTDSTTGNKRVILFSVQDLTGAGTPLVGELYTVKDIKSQLGSRYKSLSKYYKLVLDVKIPVLPNNAALTRFNVKVGGKYSPTNTKVVKASCPAKKLRLTSDFYFSNFQPPFPVPERPWVNSGAAPPTPDSYLPATSPVQKCK